MADNNKIEACWLDIPNGQGGNQRTWFKDVEAREAIASLNPASYATVAEAEAAADELD